MMFTNKEALKATAWWLFSFACLLNTNFIVIVKKLYLHKLIFYFSYNLSSLTFANNLLNE